MQWNYFCCCLCSIKSDVDSDADSISDRSNAHISDDDDGDEPSWISSTARELCNQLRVNDGRVLENDPEYNSVFVPFKYSGEYSEDERIAVFQALKENTSVKCIRLAPHKFTKRSAKAAAKYLKSSKTLQTLHLDDSPYQNPHERREMISILFRALSRNTSVTKLIINFDVVRFGCVAFQELLTNTQTLQTLSVVRRYDYRYGELNEVDIAAITSGFANNTTLRDLEFQGWRETELAPVLTALQEHPALQKIYLNESLSGLEVLLRSQDSKVKELVLEGIHRSTVGFHAVMRELGRNTRLTNLVLCSCLLKRKDVQQLKSMLRRNTALEFLDLKSICLMSAGLTELAPVLYCNTSIKTLDLANNGLDDVESANLLRELIRRNKTITSLCIAGNAFGRNAAAVRSIAEGVRSNTALQQLDVHNCSLGDQGISILANALAIRNASILELNFSCNNITSVGVRALVDDNVEAMKTVAKLSLCIRSEGAIILADALGRNAMPSLKRLDLGDHGIEDDGFVALVSALEQNTSLQILQLRGNDFGERGFVALADSLPNIKGLQQINLWANEIFQSTTLALLLEGFRKNTSLVQVHIIGSGAPVDFLQEIKCLGQRNRFTPLLTDASPQLGIWSRALAKVATEPDVLFHVLRKKPKLVGFAGRDDE
jgi:Ran GTPase-activating protein (RanGAP) involved in mRNA processing and transport